MMVLSAGVAVSPVESVPPGGTKPDAWPGVRATTVALDGPVPTGPVWSDVGRRRWW